MAKLTGLERLDTAIREWARGAEPATSNRQLAEEFYQSDRDLIAPFVDQWVIQRLAVLIGKHRTKARRQADSQLVFEEVFGFHHLPARIESLDGASVPRGKATIGLFRRLAKELQQKESEDLQQVKRVIAMMEPYTPKEPKITWAQVLEREAAKTR